jgi:hypothetical protein
MEYTTKQYAAELDKRLKEFDSAKVLFDCSAEAHRSQINRIFIEGQGAERKLGTYSKAYAARKRAKGRQDLFVNFNFTDFLQTDFATSLTKKGNSYVSGVKNVRNKEDALTKEGKPKKNKGATNSEKVDFLIERYGKQAFDLTKEERQEFQDCAREKFLKIMRG